jgi:porin
VKCLRPLRTALAKFALVMCVLARSEDGAGGEAHSALLSATYVGEAVTGLSGGASPGTVYHGSLQTMLTVDLASLLGLPQTTLFMYGIALHGGQPGDFVGDAQGVSNISARAGARLEEAWLQRTFDTGHLSVLSGRYDLNSEFYRLVSAALFLNGSFGMGPEFSQSGPAGPSVFPSTAAAVRIELKPVRALVLRTAVLAAKPFQAESQNARTIGGDGLLTIAEAAYLERPGPPEPRNRRLRIGRLSGLPPYQDKAAFGLWHYTTTFEDLSATDRNGGAVQHRGSTGGYVLFDYLLTRANPRAPHVMGFLQLGLGDTRVNRFGSYIGAGFSISSFSQSRSNDEIGFAIASAQNGAAYLTEHQRLGAPALHAESTFELTYLAQLSKSLALQPACSTYGTPTLTRIGATRLHF